MNTNTGVPADGRDPGPIGANSILDGLTRPVSRKEESATDAQADEIVARLAVQTIRSFANRHGCTHAGPCPDREAHETDIDALQDLLQMLDLPGKNDPPTDEERAGVLNLIRNSVLPKNMKQMARLVPKVKK